MSSSNNKPKKKKRPAGQGGGLPVVRPKPNRLAELRAIPILLSQNQVGKLVGLDYTTVSRHESGERGMTRDQIIAYASLYDVATHEIFFDPEEINVPIVEEGEKPV